jgi:DNA-binding NarL/FixJ family response regulator
LNKEIRKGKYVKKSLKVIVVDDSSVVRERLVDMITRIKNIGMVSQAANVSEAENIIKKINHDIAILDIRMPDGSGIEILQKLKIRNTNIKIIMLTNYPYKPYKERCSQLGADYFFDKSNEFDKIVKVINYWIDTSTMNDSD